MVTSQNATAGYRCEAGIVTTDNDVYNQFERELDNLISNGCIDFK